MARDQNCYACFGHARSLIAVGITTLISLQVIVNVAVVTSSMPVTGMPLPFFNSRSSLAFLLVGVGMLLNISRHCGDKYRLKREKY